MDSFLIGRSFFKSSRLGSSNPKFIQCLTTHQSTILFLFMLTYKISQGWTFCFESLMPLLSQFHLLEWKSPSVNYPYALIKKIASMFNCSILSCVSLLILSNISMCTLRLRTVWYPFLIEKLFDNFRTYGKFVYFKKVCFHEWFPAFYAKKYWYILNFVDKVC